MAPQKNELEEEYSLLDFAIDDNTHDSRPTPPVKNYFSFDASIEFRRFGFIQRLFDQLRIVLPCLVLLSLALHFTHIPRMYAWWTILGLLLLSLLVLILRAVLRHPWSAKGSGTSIHFLQDLFELTLNEELQVNLDLDERKEYLGDFSPLTDENEMVEEKETATSNMVNESSALPQSSIDSGNYTTDAGMDAESESCNEADQHDTGDTIPNTDADADAETLAPEEEILPAPNSWKKRVYSLSFYMPYANIKDQAYDARLRATLITIQIPQGNREITLRIPDAEIGQEDRTLLESRIFTKAERPMHTLQQR